MSLDRLIPAFIRIERLLADQFRAQGAGTREKLNSIPGVIPRELEDRIMRLARTRNLAAHEGRLPADIDEYVAACAAVEQDLRRFAQSAATHKQTATPESSPTQIRSPSAVSVKRQKPKKRPSLVEISPGLVITGWVLRLLGAFPIIAPIAYTLVTPDHPWALWTGSPFAGLFYSSIGLALWSFGLGFKSLAVKKAIALGRYQQGASIWPSPRHKLIAWLILQASGWTWLLVATGGSQSGVLISISILLALASWAGCAEIEEEGRKSPEVSDEAIEMPSAQVHPQVDSAIEQSPSYPASSADAPKFPMRVHMFNLDVEQHHKSRRANKVAGVCALLLFVYLIFEYDKFVPSCIFAGGAFFFVRVMFSPSRSRAEYVAAGGADAQGTFCLQCGRRGVWRSTEYKTTTTVARCSSCKLWLWNE